jgi:hypothetical protein
MPSRSTLVTIAASPAAEQDQTSQAVTEPLPHPSMQCSHQRPGRLIQIAPACPLEACTYA